MNLVDDDHVVDNKDSSRASLHLGQHSYDESVFFSFILVRFSS
jgi:hypothetical protein